LILLNLMLLSITSATVASTTATPSIFHDLHLD
jgi:predicted exporter